jgi:hypothetical protein
MNAVYQSAIAWLEAIKPAGVTIIVANQNAPSPPRPYMTVRISESGDIAHYKAPNVDEHGNLPITRWVRLTCALQIFGRPEQPLEAETIAQHIADRVYNDTQRIDILGRSLAFNQILTGPQSVDQIAGVEWEPRAILDLGMSASRDLEYEIGAIEIVEIKGEVDDREFEFTVTSDEIED